MKTVEFYGSHSLKIQGLKDHCLSLGDRNGVVQLICHGQNKKYEWARLDKPQVEFLRDTLTHWLEHGTFKEETRK